MAESDLLCRAIRERLVVEFDYRGRHRVVAPYCHGTSTRGAEVLRAVQLRGESSAGGFGFGKLWIVAEIRNARVSGERFVAHDPDYNPNDRGMAHIHCRV